MLSSAEAYQGQLVAMQQAQAALWHQMAMGSAIGMYGGEHFYNPQPWPGQYPAQQRRKSRQRGHSRTRQAWQNQPWGQGVDYDCRHSPGRRASPGPTSEDARNRAHTPNRYGPNMEDAKDFPKDFCLELEEKLKAGGEECEEALAKIRNSVWKLAVTSSGCRLVQAAIRGASPKDAQVLAQEMKHKVLEAIKSPHANYVIQGIIQGLPVASFIFIAEELKNNAYSYSRHRFGCRVMCRLLQHSSSVSETMELVDEALEYAADLSRHSFGHHVMESVLEHCQPRQKQRLVESLTGDPSKGDLLRSARSRNASFVIEKALMECDDNLRKAIANELLNPKYMVSLAHSQPGYFVLLALLKLDDDSALRGIHFLKTAQKQFEDTKYGKKLLEELGLTGPEQVYVSAPTTA